MFILNLFRDFKNSAVEVLAKKFVTSRINDYGQMVNLQIDSKTRILNRGLT